MKKSSTRREQHKAVPSARALKKEQGTQVEKHLVRGRRKTMATAPKSHMHVKKMAVEGVPTGKNSANQPQAQVYAATQEETFQGPLLLSSPLVPSPGPQVPVTMGQQLAVPLSGELYGPSAMPNMYSSVILQPCVTPGPLLLPPQVLGPNVFDQASVSTALEWQEMLEAAEALMTLKNSALTRNRNQLHNMPGPAGERGLQPPNPSVPPRAASSSSLSTGHLDCFSLLT
uniref:doublesex- and mab-3-related transcription factor C1 isoform X1 n=2 Tax=Jaculus jaculus TaxID=51337 RepID=UPI001E1B0A63|nr:doublesex- and mab-3-related transcription factor C1 isoform X1 [Jaculus jaculus]